ncbi:MAG TPA: hypothetical protein VFO85_00480, partial [Vicinamibacteria bacterium]|nr:hypothetical protein [Vicinamibacteria bacterium]
MRRARRALGMAGPAACALALAGCYGSPEPLGPAAQGTVDRALVGDWRCSSAGDGSETALVWIFPLDGTQYVVEWRTADETDHYRAHASRAGDETLLNVRELTSGRAGEEWYFLRYRIDEGRRLRLSLVDDEALGGLEGEAALDAIRRRAADPALYTDLAVCQAVDRPATSDDEAAAARAVFEKNLEAIARRDREA